ncbi:hypothetical protein [Streptomyces sp. NPDC093225]|uniref:hypothetical protein n=1 Tax=Streptomyces sp. NPDC093225 TaxID=3366034 RepID=UPI0037F70892
MTRIPISMQVGAIYARPNNGVIRLESEHMEIDTSDHAPMSKIAHFVHPKQLVGG